MIRDRVNSPWGEAEWAIEGEGSDCFSITQLVGRRQKKQQSSLQMQVEERFIWE